jgi:23S rRNA (cytosine1962-C5)-methyltransferase
MNLIRRRRSDSNNAMPRAYLKSGRQKSLLRRHPWIFSGAIERIDGAPTSGATVDVLSDAGQFLARAAYSPESQIRFRVWTFDESEPVTDAFFARRLEHAVASRRRLGLMTDDAACRLVFGESDGLPGLIVDRYAGFLVCQFSAAGVEFWRDTIVESLLEICRPRGIYERSESGSRHKERLKSRRGLLVGEEPPPLVELRYEAGRHLVDIVHGQKTGAYLDQQRNRARVASYARGSSVLDAFAYTGGFAIGCLRAGATRATLVESSAEALAIAERNAELNAVASACEFTAANVFDELRRLRDAGRRFDLVVIDPPKFVHSVDQISAGSRGYKDVNIVALQLVAPGGFLATFSCSGHVAADLFQKIVAGAALDARRSVQILERLAQPQDHPVALEFPEGEYLKGLVLRVQ